TLITPAARRVQPMSSNRRSHGKGETRITIETRRDDRMTVAVQDLTMRYGDRLVLDSVSFDVGRGEVVALLGPNGAGKSTTIETLEGLRRPSSGTVRVLGRDPQNADDAWRARLGVVLQTWNDHGKWTVRSLLDHLSNLYAAVGEVRDVDELLYEVSLSAAARQRLSLL